MVFGKRFNTVGVCVPSKHYMVDITKKLVEIKELIDNGFYFTMNKPRQYGKTTTIGRLSKFLGGQYLVIDISFEGVGDSVFKDEEIFSKTFLELLSESIEMCYESESSKLRGFVDEVSNIKQLSKVITRFVRGISKDVVLIIDEVDKSSNNQLFLSFLGMLRNKYLNRELGKDFTFRTVILAGVHDVKNLKLKLRDEEETKYNSPWNIAVDFKIDMSFSKEEIASMLKVYVEDNKVSMDVDAISSEVYFFTSGYPYLVSRLCQIIDENFKQRFSGVFVPCWTKDDVQFAVKSLLEEKNTLFESLIKNLENNSDFYEYMEEIVVRGVEKIFNVDNPFIDLGLTLGYFKNQGGKVTISNRIFYERIWNYMISKQENRNESMEAYNFKGAFINDRNGLNMEKILLRFQDFMREQYSSKDNKFVEKHGRLLFLAFIKPIINGVGFEFKEVQISEEKRLDLVITYNNFKYIVEMKIWRGPKYHEDGVKQLCEYLDINNMKQGYLLVFNFNEDKEYKSQNVMIEHREVFEIFV